MIIHLNHLNKLSGTAVMNSGLIVKVCLMFDAMPPVFIRPSQDGHISYGAVCLSVLLFVHPSVCQKTPISMW